MPPSPCRDLALKDPWVSLPEVHRLTGRATYPVALMIRSGLIRYVPLADVPKVRPLSPEAIEEAVFRRRSRLDIRQRRRKGELPSKPTQPTPGQVARGRFRRRSGAARRGWATRRARNSRTRTSTTVTSERAKAIASARQEKERVEREWAAAALLQMTVSAFGQPLRSRHRTSPEERRRIASLALMGRVPVGVLMKATGLAQSTIWRIVAEFRSELAA